MDENKAEKLSGLFGGKAALARIIGRTPAIVTRMCARGIVRAEFNPQIKAHISDNSEAMGEKWALSAYGCLEQGGVCPSCGKPID